MRIIVVGCGKVGCTIIESFLSEGHEIIAMDNDPDVVSELSNIYDVMTLCGNGTDSDALLEAGANKCELMIAVTGSDEFNMLSCFLAKRMGTAHTIARIRGPEYNDKSLAFIKKELDIWKGMCSPQPIPGRDKKGFCSKEHAAFCLYI